MGTPPATPGFALPSEESGSNNDNPPRIASIPGFHRYVGLRCRLSHLFHVGVLLANHPRPRNWHFLSIGMGNPPAAPEFELSRSKKWRTSSNLSYTGFPSVLRHPMPGIAFCLCKDWRRERRLTPKSTLLADESRFDSRKSPRTSPMPGFRRYFSLRYRASIVLGYSRHGEKPRAIRDFGTRRRYRAPKIWKPLRTSSNFIVVWASVTGERFVLYVSGWVAPLIHQTSHFPSVEFVFRPLFTGLFIPGIAFFSVSIGTRNPFPTPEFELRSETWGAEKQETFSDLSRFPSFFDIWYGVFTLVPASGTPSDTGYRCSVDIIWFPDIDKPYQHTPALGFGLFSRAFRACRYIW